MFEVSVGNEILRTVKGTFDEANDAVAFIYELINEGYSSDEIYVYFTNTGIVKTHTEILNKKF